MELLRKIREKKPLILNITNYVTMDFVANCLLAIGSSPIMSVFKNETEELLNISSAVNINIGTLDNQFIDHCLYLVKKAKSLNKPIILDPVGSGATKIRTDIARELCKFSDIIKGNASEIISLLSNDESITKGVDSKHNTHSAIDTARKLANTFNNIIVITGKTDIVVSRDHSAESPHGSSIMSSITGMGCALGGIIAAFRAVHSNSFESALNAVKFFGLTGEKALNISKKPASFKTAFIDMLYQ